MKNIIILLIAATTISAVELQSECAEIERDNKELFNFVLEECLSLVRPLNNYEDSKSTMDACINLVKGTKVFKTGQELVNRCALAYELNSK